MALKSKYAIFERFNIEGLYNTFLGLPPREQIISLVVVAVVLVLIVIMPISLAAGRLSGFENAISSGREQIDEVARGIGDYNSERARLAKVETRLKTGFDTSISTTLEGLASQSGIKESIASLKERAPVPSDIYDEASVDVRLSKVTLDQVVDFLYKIESDRTKVLRVKQLQIKPRYDNKKLLDVSFRVSTFRLSGEGG